MRLYKGIFFRIKLHAEEKAIKIPPGYSFAEINRRHIEEDPVFSEKQRRERFLRFLQDGHRCYGFFTENGNIASYIWLTTQNRELTVPWIFKGKLILRPNIGYIWNCFTDSAHRRKGLYTAGLLKGQSISLKEGARDVYIYCAADNAHSRAGILKALFTEEFSFSGIGMLGIYLIRKGNEPYRFMIRKRPYDIIQA